MFLSKPMLGTQLDRSDSLNNPVLDLLFNEGHGNRVNDLSGYGNHGTLHGFDFPPTRTSGWNPGMDGVTLTCDGSDDYISMPNSPSLNPTMGITMDVRVFWKGQNYMGIIEKGTFDNNHGQYGLHIGAGTIRISLNQDVRVIGALPLTVNAWNDIVGTYSEDEEKVKLYINGIKDDAEGDYSIPLTPTNDTLAIGHYYFPLTETGGALNGSIARARILPRAMSAFEVMQTQINPYAGYL